MNEGWNALSIATDLFAAGAFAFALTFAGRLIFNVTSNDDTDSQNRVFRDEHGRRFRGVPLWQTSMGEAFGFLFMSRLGIVIAMGLTSLFCLICAGSGSLDMSDAISDLASGNQSSHTDWNQAQWVVASAISIIAWISVITATQPAVKTSAKGH